MNLPNAELAFVEKEKVTEYLLNRSHCFGSGKAIFFGEFEFRLDDCEKLADALLRHGQSNPVSRVKATPFGVRYEIDARLDTPDGRLPRIRTVWQLNPGDIRPRLITAYPLEKEE